MAKFATLRREEVGGSPAHPLGRSWTGVVDARLLSPPPPDYPLWLVDAELADGAVLEWHADCGEEALYVQRGELTVAGRRCPAGGAVVIESGARCTVRAVGGAWVAHLGAAGSAQPAPAGPPADGALGPPPQPDGHGVHVVGPGGVWRSGALEGVHAVWFADSTCPTCRVTLFTVESSEAVDGPAHTHSQDEIIYLLDGGIRMGAQVFGAGTSLCIPHDLRYRFRGEEGGHRFLNFRRGLSYQTNAGAEPLIETPEARAGVYVGDVR